MYVDLAAQVSNLQIVHFPQILWMIISDQVATGIHMTQGAVKISTIFLTV